MNFYKHHIGDYARDTSHLSFIEDAAYSRLMRRYYSTEKPLPADTDAVARLVGARTKDEKAAVPAMLQEFFTLEPDGWHQKRCDEEIAAAQDKANRNREVGRLGGRPHKLETQTVSNSKPKVNPNGFHLEPINNPIQTPIARLHKPDSNSEVGAPNGAHANGKAKAKTQIPVDFTITDELREQALKRIPDVDPDELFVQFRAHHESHGKTMKSWPAAWTTWIGNAVKFGYPKKQSTVRKWD